MNARRSKTISKGIPCVVPLPFRGLKNDRVVIRFPSRCFSSFTNSRGSAVAEVHSREQVTRSRRLLGLLRFSLPEEEGSPHLEPFPGILRMMGVLAFYSKAWAERAPPPPARRALAMEGGFAQDFTPSFDTYMTSTLRGGKGRGLKCPNFADRQY